MPEPNQSKQTRRFALAIVSAVILGVVATRAMPGRRPDPVAAARAPHPTVLADSRSDSVALELGQPTGNSDSLRRAEADSSFARSYRMLAVLLGQDTADSSKLYSALRQAYALGTRVSRLTQERYLIEGAYHAYISHDTAALIRTLTGGLERYSGEAADAASWLTAIYYDREQTDSALVYAMRYVRNGSPSAGFFAGWIPLQLAAGNPDSARVMLDAFAASYPRNPDVVHLRASRLLRLGLGDSAVAVVRRGMEKLADDSGATRSLRFVLDDIALTRGRVTEWDALFTESVLSGVASRGPQDTVAARQLRWRTRWLHDERMRTALSVLRDTVMARTHLDSALSVVPASERWSRPTDFLTAAVYLASTGQVDQATAYLRRWEAEAADSVRNAPGAGAYARGLIAHVAGRFAEAIPHWRAADCTACSLRQATGFAALGQLDSAAANLDRYMVQVRKGGLEMGAPQLESVAALYERLGDRTRALAAYEQIVALWHDADPVLQPRVAHARERAAALRRR